MECIFNSSSRKTCWRGYNYCKFLKTSNLVSSKPFMICLLETQKLVEIPINRDCPYFTKSRKTAIEKIKRLRKLSNI